MVDTQLDAMGFMDFSRSQPGSGMSKTAQVRKMTNLLQQRAQIKGSSIFSVQDMKDIARVIKSYFYSFIRGNVSVDFKNKRNLIRQNNIVQYALYTMFYDRMSVIFLLKYTETKRGGILSLSMW